jgi:U3 small nucleolar RNA-associated protein 13
LEIPLLTYNRSIPKASSAPILLTCVSPDSTLFATASSDGVVKIYDTVGAYITHVFRGHGGPVSAIRFWYNVEGTRMELWTGSSDSKVRVFDLRDASARVVGGGGGKAKWVLEGHVSVVRGVDVSVDGRWAVTGGRDKVVLVWNLVGEGKKVVPKVVQTIIAQEQVETLGLLPVEGGVLRCWTGGEKGVVRIWDVLKAKEICSMKGLDGVDEVDEDEEDEHRGIVNAM